MDSVKTVLKKFNPVTDKYISREFQSFALKLANDLDDYKHRAIYMRLAKTVHRSILERALSFAIDSNAKNKGALFMWKLKEIRSKGTTGTKSATSTTGKK